MVSDDDILKLARKAYPGALANSGPMSQFTDMTTGHVDARLYDRRGRIIMLVADHPRAREAMHAALAVLARRDDAPSDTRVRLGDPEVP